MNITEFQDHVQERLKKFAVYYATSRKEDGKPENWPNEMDEPEWWEMFLEYLHA